MTPRSQVEVTQAEIIVNRWLVNTPARTTTLTYDQHDTATRIILSNQTLWITVPKGSILHIDDLVSYHLTDDEYQAEIEISPFVKQHSFVLDPELEERIEEEGTQLINLTPVDTALEAITHLPPASVPLIQSWSAADTALCISTIVGYVVTLTLAFLLHKRVNAVQESFNKCTSGIPYIFQRDKTDQEPKPENSTTLIEPPHSQLLFLSLFLLTRSAFIQSQNVFYDRIKREMFQMCAPLHSSGSRKSNERKRY